MIKEEDFPLVKQFILSFEDEYVWFGENLVTKIDDKQYLEWVPTTGLTLSDYTDVILPRLAKYIEDNRDGLPRIYIIILDFEEREVYMYGNGLHIEEIIRFSTIVLRWLEKNIPGIYKVVLSPRIDYDNRRSS